MTWLGAGSPGLRVSAGAVGREPADEGIDVFLLGTAPRNEPRSIGQIRHTLALDYFIAVRRTDPIAEHGLLADLAFDALNQPGCEPVAVPTPADACRALGIGARAGFVLRIEARREQALPRAPLVREVVTQFGPLGLAEGTVTGPGGVPIANAIITIAGGDRSATTDARGRFSLALPGDRPTAATVRARGHQATAQLTPGKPATIPINLEA
jgi:hypothetical protein